MKKYLNHNFYRAVGVILIVLFEYSILIFGWFDPKTRELIAVVCLSLAIINMLFQFRTHVFGFLSDFHKTQARIFDDISKIK